MLIPIEEGLISGKLLELGYRGKFVHFRHREYKDRPITHQADYVLLKVSIMKQGVKKPIIVFDNHVLIGMRRYEIMMEIDPEHIFKCAVIQEDVNEWTRDDLPRLDELKQRIGEVEY